MNHIKGRNAEETNRTLQPETSEKTGEKMEKQNQTDMQNKNQANKENGFSVRNADVYIKSAIKDNVSIVIKAVENYCLEKGLDVKSAECINCAIPSDHPLSTEFFFELDNAEHSVVQAIYDPRTKMVSVAPSEFTKEEILNEIWITDGAPTIRDVQE